MPTGGLCGAKLTAVCWMPVRGLATFLLVVGLLLFGARTSKGGAPELDQVLRSWVTQNIYLEQDQLILIRKQPVRALISTDNIETASEARTAIANFSDAFHLGLEFASLRPNLIVATANGIADKDGKPNRVFLSSLGLPEAVSDQISKSTQWSSGCGFYSSRNTRGQILISIVAGDKALPEKKLKSCVVTGVAVSFGLRARGQEILDFSNDYVQFLLLARSLAACDKKFSAQHYDKLVTTRDYVECIVADMKAKLFE
jgi:hypothetical protein